MIRAYKGCKDAGYSPRFMISLQKIPLNSPSPPSNLCHHLNRSLFVFLPQCIFFALSFPVGDTVVRFVSPLLRSQTILTSNKQTPLPRRTYLPSGYGYLLLASILGLGNQNHLIADNKMGSLIQSLSRVLHPKNPNSAALDFTWLTVQLAKYACTCTYLASKLSIAFLICH